jgi:hypothetical protein
VKKWEQFIDGLQDRERHEAKYYLSAADMLIVEHPITSKMRPQLSIHMFSLQVGS